jgi:hypothetical protein
MFLTTFLYISYGHQNQGDKYFLDKSFCLSQWSLIRGKYAFLPGKKNHCSEKKWMIFMTCLISQRQISIFPTN